MGVLRRKQAAEPDLDVSVGYNPDRDDYLFWLTEEGYVIAQDELCMQEYVEQATCSECGGSLVVIAHLNRGGQGLTELVVVCQGCRQRYNVIFDISNDVYQRWWKNLLGPLYICQHDGPARQPCHPPG
ncbi:MAG: hypothetical protein GXY36_04975 [Chloroflexi bacterium]|nr:hypothetical protein [Chloroflexota bacterium]